MNVVPAVLSFAASIFLISLAVKSNAKEFDLVKNKIEDSIIYNDQVFKDMRKEIDALNKRMDKIERECKEWKLWKR